MLTLARDVTGRKEAEERARETEARYRTLVEQIPAVTYVQEPFGDKRVTYVSPRPRACSATRWTGSCSTLTTG